MAAKKFSQLDELTTLTGDEEIPSAYNNANYKFKISKIKSLVTKGDVGLGNVDNTSDINKPVSTAVQGALNGKANFSHNHQQTDVTGLIDSLAAKANTIHEHPISEVTGLQIQLDSKSDINHSHGLAQLPEVQTALNNKASLTHAHNVSDITGLSNIVSDLNIAVANKADINHTQLSSSITDFNTKVQEIIAQSGGVGGGDVTVNNLEW